MLVGQRDGLQQQYEQLSQQTTQAVRQWSDKQQVSLRYTPTAAANDSTRTAVNSHSVPACCCLYVVTER